MCTYQPVSERRTRLLYVSAWQRRDCSAPNRGSRACKAGRQPTIDEIKLLIIEYIAGWPARRVAARAVGRLGRRAADVAAAACE